MQPFFNDYFWRKGIPVGHTRVPTEAPQGYKIIVDPYHKRYTIERYASGQFQGTVYDSLLLDFRHLKPSEQQGWQREVLSQDALALTCLIRNQEDRIVYTEKHTFEDHRCRECVVYSPHGLVLSRNRMFYKSLQDPFDGVLLYDNHNHIVMAKRYAVDGNGDFGELLEERWDLQDDTFLSQWQLRKTTIRTI